MKTEQARASVAPRGMAEQVLSEPGQGAGRALRAEGGLLGRIRGRCALWRYGGAVVLYLAIALWLEHPFGHPLGKEMLNDSGDPNMYLYMLKWWPWALAHGRNPFVIRGLTWPAPYNAAWITSGASPALLMGPITLLFGPVFSWNVLMLLAPVLAGVAMVGLLDEVGVPIVPSWLGGWAFGFSSYELGQLLSHVFLVLIFPLPLLALLVLRLVRGKLRPQWFVVAFAVVGAFLVYDSTELAFTATVAACVAAVCLAIWQRDLLKEQFRRHWRTGVVAIGGVGVLCAPLGYYLVIGSRQASGLPPNPAVVYSTNLLNFVTPTAVTLLGHASSQGVARSFTGNPAEQGGYIGFVLLIVTCVAIAEGVRRGRWAWALAAWTGALAVLTLGPRLHVDGVATRVPLPWLLAVHLPVARYALPSRLMVYVAFGIAIWVGLWCSWATSRRSKLLRSGLVMVGLVLTLGNPGVWSWSTPMVPRSVGDGELARWLGPGGGLLVVPTGSVAPAPEDRLGALWAEASGFEIDASQREWGSYNPYSNGVGWHRWFSSREILDPKPVSGLGTYFKEFVIAHDDRGVAVLPGFPAWGRLLSGFGWKKKRFGTVAVYRVPERLLRARTKVGIEAEAVDSYQHELRVLERAGRCYLERGGKVADLTPDAAIDRKCLSTTWRSAEPSSNWTRFAGWVGPQPGGVWGVGVGLSGTLAAKVLRGVPGAKQFMMWDPRPRRVTLSEMLGGPEATYIALLPPIPASG